LTLSRHFILLQNRNAIVNILASQFFATLSDHPLPLYVHVCKL
jgi:hypothetical protein